MASFFPSPTFMRKKLPELTTFLKSISQENPVGPSLRYDLLYDEIRLARQEDDPRLSMGIWTTELKHADWNKVEDLCIDALTNKSKDLQISGWLTEAWISLDEIEGYIRGIALLLSLSEAFWKTIHPQPQDGEDMENRYMIFDWMDTALSSRLLTIPLTQSKFDQTTFGLGFYKSAQYGDAAQKRVDQTRNRPTKIDPSKAIGTVDQFQKSLDQTSNDFLAKRKEDTETAIQVTQAFKNALFTIIGEATPSFSKILGILKEMERILNTALQSREPSTPETMPEPIPEVTPEPIPEVTPEPILEVTPEPILEVIPDSIISEKPSVKTSITETPQITIDVKPPAPEISPPEEAITTQLPPSTEIPLHANSKNRDDAYRQLEMIANYLDQSDPHSLAPKLIRQLIRWKNKNIVDILGEIAKTPQEYDILIRILGSESSQKVTTDSPSDKPAEER